MIQGVTLNLFIYQISAVEKHFPFDLFFQVERKNILV